MRAAEVSEDAAAPPAPVDAGAGPAVLLGRRRDAVGRLLFGSGRL